VSSDRRWRSAALLQALPTSQSLRIQIRNTYTHYGTYSKEGSAKERSRQEAQIGSHSEIPIRNTKPIPGNSTAR